MRHAIYFTPEREDPLARAAASWLGRDAFGRDALTRPTPDGFSPGEMADLTAEPRRYGFHGTLVAPFRLREGQNEQGLYSALSDFCARHHAFTIPRLSISRIGTFFALVPDKPATHLDALAGNLVRHFASFRAPLLPDEIERRRPERLTPRQREHLAEWGYPYVFDDFRFHMTLTGPISPPDHDRIARALDDWFGPVLNLPMAVSRIAIFLEDQPGAPFIFHSSAPLRSDQDTSPPV